MNAIATAATLPERTTKLPYCAVPAAVLNRLVKITNYTQAVCFGYVLVKTIGETRRAESAEIPWYEFAQATNKTEDWCQEAVGDLTERYKFLKYTPGARVGHGAYSIAASFADEIRLAGAKNVYSHCDKCESEQQFDIRFFTVPHAALRKLGACVDHTTWLCVMWIIRDSLSWRDGEFHSKFTAFKFADFEDETGAGSRSISTALANAERLGIIERKKVGRDYIYRAIPEGFNKLKPAAGRHVTHHPQVGTETKAKVKPVESVDKSSKTAIIPATESLGKKIYAVCQKCGTFAPIVPRFESEAEKAERKAVQRARAGPPAQIKSTYKEFPRDLWKQKA